MNWRNITETYFKNYAKDWAECVGVELTEKEIDDLVAYLMEDDYLFETIDNELKSLCDMYIKETDEEDEEEDDENE